MNLHVNQIYNKLFISKQTTFFKNIIIFATKTIADHQAKLGALLNTCTTEHSEQASDDSESDSDSSVASSPSLSSSSSSDEHTSPLPKRRALSRPVSSSSTAQRFLGHTKSGRLRHVYPESISVILKMLLFFQIVFFFFFVVDYPADLSDSQGVVPNCHCLLCENPNVGVKPTSWATRIEGFFFFFVNFYIYFFSCFNCIK